MSAAGHPPAPAVIASSRHDTASAAPDPSAPRAARTGSVIPRLLTRTWNAAIPSELISTTTAEMARGASVCRATHSGSALDSIAQHSASTPMSAARLMQGKVSDHPQPTVSYPRRSPGARGERRWTRDPRRPHGLVSPDGGST